jgi:hypothetical protein
MNEYDRRGCLRVWDLCPDGMAWLLSRIQKAEISRRPLRAFGSLAGPF